VSAEKNLSGGRETRGDGRATGTVTVRQIASAAGRQSNQRATLKGLGLDKLNRVRTLPDTPAVRGMIARVHHLVRVESGT